MRAWTDQIRHYGNNTTSRNEGAHSGLKAWLQCARNDLLTFFDKMIPFYSGHIDRYNAALTAEQNTGNSSFQSDRLYVAVIRVIASRGLHLLKQQRTIAKWFLDSMKADPSFVLPPCSGRFQRAYGIPCAHKIMPFLSSQGSLAPPRLEANHFDPHWIIPGGQMPEVVTGERIYEPRIRHERRKQRISHQRGHGGDGTIRDATRPERLDPNHRATPPPGSELATQLARRNENTNSRLAWPLEHRRYHTNKAPGGSVRCGCSKGCIAGKCRCRKAKKACSRYCHTKHGENCSNMDDPMPAAMNQPAHQAQQQTLTQILQQQKDAIMANVQLEVERQLQAVLQQQRSPVACTEPHPPPLENGVYQPPQQYQTSLASAHQLLPLYGIPPTSGIATESVPPPLSQTSTWQQAPAWKTSEQQYQQSCSNHDAPAPLDYHPVRAHLAPRTWQRVGQPRSYMERSRIK